MTTILLAVLGGALGGVLGGLYFGERRYNASLERMLSYGSPAKLGPAVVDPPAEEPEQRIMREFHESMTRPPSEESVTRGAEYLLKAAAEAGISLTAEEAREQAREMLTA